MSSFLIFNQHELEEIEKSMGLVDGGKRKSDIDGKIYIWDRLAHGIWKARAEKKPKVIINFQEKMSKISQYSLPFHIAVH